MDRRRSFAVVSLASILAAAGLTSLVAPVAAQSSSSPTATDAPIGDPSALATADTTDGYCLDYRAPAETSEATLEAAAGTLDVRLGSMGIAGDATADPSSDLVKIALKPGPEDLTAATDLAAGLAATGALEFLPVPPELQGSVGAGPLPEGMQDLEPLFDGSGVIYAAVSEDDWTGEVVVDLELTADASRRFDAYAAEHYGEQFAILVDDEVLSAPIIQAQRFGGRAQISGGSAGFQPAEAQALAAALLSGGLPVGLAVDDVRACQVPAALAVQVPRETLARAGEDLERPALRLASRLHDLGVADFVITFHPEADRVDVTVLSTDPALVRPVEGVLSRSRVSELGEVAFTDSTLDAFLESLPDQPVALRWSGSIPDGTEWQPETGALIGDPSDLGTGRTADIDVEAVVELYDRAEAFDARLTEVTDDPRFVGFSTEDDALVLLFVRDSIPSGRRRGALEAGRPDIPGRWDQGDPWRGDRPHPRRGPGDPGHARGRPRRTRAQRGGAPTHIPSAQEAPSGHPGLRPRGRVVDPPGRQGSPGQRCRAPVVRSELDRARPCRGRSVRWAHRRWATARHELRVSVRDGSPNGLVAEIHDAGPERPRLEQPQADAVPEGREVGRASAEDDRMHDDPVLVHQSALDERRRQCRAPYTDVARELGADLGQAIGHVTRHQPAARADRVQGRREDDDWLRVPNAGEFEHRLGRRWVGLGRRPVGRHHLVQPPPIQGRLQRPFLSVEPGVQLIIDDRPVQAVIDGLDEAVE